jgi:hypothetical protein
MWVSTRCEAFSGFNEDIQQEEQKDERLYSGIAVIQRETSKKGSLSRMCEHMSSKEDRGCVNVFISDSAADIEVFDAPRVPVDFGIYIASDLKGNDYKNMFSRITDWVERARADDSVYITIIVDNRDQALCGFMDAHITEIYNHGNIFFNKLIF